MAESSNTAPRRHNRANWVALRTLRQLPKVIGETSAGEPIVEIRSVRLVLRDGAAHFSRLASCSKCGREVPGAPVLSPSDLDQPPHPVICKDCVRTAEAPVLRPHRRPADPAPDQPRSRNEGPQPADTRLAALEQQVAELMELVKAPPANGDAALEERVRETRAELRSLATAARDTDATLKGVIERLGAAAPADAGFVQAMEERLAERVEAQRAELGADLEVRFAKLHAVLEDHARRTEQLAAAHDEMRHRVDGLAHHAGAPDNIESARLQVLEQRVQELRGGLDAEIARAHVETARVDEATAGLADVGERLNHRLDRLVEERSQSEQAPQDLTERVAQIWDRVGARLGEDADRLRERLARLQAGVQAEAAATASRIDDVDARLAGIAERFESELARAVARVADIEERLNERLQEEAERLAEMQDTVEARLGEYAERLRADIEARLAGIDERFESEVARARADAASADEIKGALVKLEEEVSQRTKSASAEGRRLQGVDERLERLEESVAGSQTAAATAQAQLHERLDRLAQQVARPSGEAERLTEIEQQVEDAIGRLVPLIASLKTEVREDLGRGLADTRSAMKQLEEAESKRAKQLSDLTELQSTLDTGLGELRAEIEQIRDTAKRAAHFDSRLEAVIDIPDMAPIEPEHGRRGAKKSADALATISGLVQNLLHDHRQLRAQVATLENESETAVRASARASAQAMAVHPLRQDLKAVRGELAQLRDALTALTENVDALSWGFEPGPAPEPARKATAAKASTKKAPAKRPVLEAAAKAAKAAKATKAAQATKAAKATKATKKA